MLIRSLGFVRHYDVFIELLEKYKDSLPQNKLDALELVIIRLRSIRVKKRKELLGTIRILKGKKFKESFREFISK